MRKGFSPVLVVIAVLGILLLSIFVIGRIYFFGNLKSSVQQGTPIYSNLDATKDWQTQNDPDLNISFKYPTGWGMWKPDSNMIYLCTPEPCNNTSAGEGRLMVIIDRATRTGSKNADELVAMKKHPKNATMGGTYYYKNQKEFLVNYYDAFYVEQTNEALTTASGETYLLDGKGGGVIFTAGRDKEKSQTFMKEIMSTLKFL